MTPAGKKLTKMLSDAIQKSAPADPKDQKTCGGCLHPLVDHRPEGPSKLVKISDGRVSLRSRCRICRCSRVDWKTDVRRKDGLGRMLR